MCDCPPKLGSKAIDWSVKNPRTPKQKGHKSSYKSQVPKLTPTFLFLVSRKKTNSPLSFFISENKSISDFACSTWRIWGFGSLILGIGERTWWELARTDFCLVDLGCLLVWCYMEVKVMLWMWGGGRGWWLFMGVGRWGRWSGGQQCVYWKVYWVSGCGNCLIVERRCVVGSNGWWSRLCYGNGGWRWYSDWWMLTG